MSQIRFPFYWVCRRSLPILLMLVLTIALLSGCGANKAIYTNSPEDFLCRATDLPAEGDYYLPGDGLLAQTSNESLLSRNAVDNTLYINATGRLDGWVAQYDRQAQASDLPEKLFCGIVSYASAEGARLSVTDYNAAVLETPGWELIPEKVAIGDESVVLVYRSTNTGEIRVWKFIEFSQRNMVIDIGALGLEEGINLGSLEQIGRVMLERIRELGTLATPTPMP